MSEESGQGREEGKKEGGRKRSGVPCQLHIELAEVVQVDDDAAALLACGKEGMVAEGWDA
jgi:hypothetical protein